MRAPTIVFIVVMLLLAFWLAGLRAFTRDVAEASAVANVKPADAIVALTGGSNRLQTAFDLLEAEKGKKLFISGVYRGVEVQELLNLWRQENHAGLDCCVVLGFEADDTLGNARETVAWLKKEKYKSIILVTANYHLKRAVLSFRRFDPNIRITPHPVAPEGLDMQNWWRDTRYRSLIVREYSKYVASLVLSILPGTPS